MTRRPGEIRAVETGVGLLLRAGFATARATRMYLAFIDTVLSHATTEAACHALPPERHAADERAWREVYQDLDPAAHPVDLPLEALAARAPGRRPG